MDTKLMGVEDVIEGQDTIQHDDVVSGENGLVGNVESLVLSQTKVKTYRVRSKANGEIVSSPADKTKLLSKSKTWWKSLNEHLSSGEIVDLGDDAVPSGYARRSRTYKADEEEIDDSWYKVNELDYASVSIADQKIKKMVQRKDFTDKVVLDGMNFYFAYISSFIQALSAYRTEEGKKLLALAMDLKQQGYSAVFFYP